VKHKTKAHGRAQLFLGVTVESYPAGLGSFVICLDGGLVNAASVISTSSIYRGEGIDTAEVKVKNDVLGSSFNMFVVPASQKD
jgi:hypothetical protein